MARTFPRFLTTLALLLGCSDIYQPSYNYASVAVRAVDQSGAPVSGAELILYFGDFHHDFGVTRLDGTHTFEFVPAGAYGVAATHPGEYRTASGTEPYRIVSVEKGGHAAVEFIFESLGG